MAYDFDDYPPSPTLTNPDMILPSAFDSSSPTKSISKRLSAATNLAISELAKFHQQTPISPGPTSPSTLVRPSSPLEVIEESDFTPKRPRYNVDRTLASSPTLRTIGKPVEWPLNANQRRLSGASNESSSVHSDDIENWTPTHTVNDADESVVGDDEKFAKQTDGEGNIENGTSAPKEDEEDFLSRRAEMILANAKKRLNLMEGNLKGARHSLSSTTLSSRYSYASASRLRQSYLQGSQSTPGHSRAVSEASVPSPVPSLPIRPKMLPQRSSSALGSFAGGLGVLDRSGSLRGVRSQEAMRESRLKNWILDDRSPSNSVDHGRPASAAGHHYTSSRGSPTPSELKRPGSQASEIRAQMMELKDRISEIKERARSSGKRASTLSLKSTDSVSSGGTETYKFPPSNPSTGPPAQKGNSPVQSPGPQDFAVKKAPKQYVPSQNGIDEADEYAESHYEDAEETLDELEDELDRHDYYPTPYNGDGMIGDVLDELPEEEEDELEEINEEVEYDDEAGSISGNTEYYDSETVIERHEDRVDAFDYEHFILHSVMGSYSQGRRDSYSSESSVETTRAASPLRTATHLDSDTSENGVTMDENGNLAPYSPFDAVHERSMSMQSVSTLASFQTAESGYDHDEDDDGEDDFDELDAAHHQTAVATAQPILFQQRNFSPRKHPGTMPVSPVPAPPFSSMTSRELRASFTELFNFFLTQESVDPGADDLKQKDRALIESVVVAMQKCCIEMQQSINGRRDGLKDRLVVVKRVLEGDEGGDNGNGL